MVQLRWWCLSSQFEWLQQIFSSFAASRRLSAESLRVEQALSLAAGRPGPPQPACQPASRPPGPRRACAALGLAHAACLAACVRSNPTIGSLPLQGALRAIDMGGCVPPEPKSHGIWSHLDWLIGCWSASKPAGWQAS